MQSTIVIDVARLMHRLLRWGCHSRWASFFPGYSKGLGQHSDGFKIVIQNILKHLLIRAQVSHPFLQLIIFFRSGGPVQAAEVRVTLIRLSHHTFTASGVRFWLLKVASLIPIFLHTSSTRVPGLPDVKDNLRLFIFGSAGAPVFYGHV